MEPRPNRYCIQHQAPGQPPAELSAHATYAEAVRALSAAGGRLLAEGATGRVVLVDCGWTADRELERYDLVAGRDAPSVSEPSGPAADRR
jgi:hypothetical protein